MRLLKHYSGELHINVGSGQELTIAELGELVADATGYDGRIVYDRSKPDGTPRKLLDSSRLRALGWRPLIDLPIGVAGTSRWFAQNETLTLG